MIHAGYIFQHHSQQCLLTAEPTCPSRIDVVTRPTLCLLQWNSRSWEGRMSGDGCLNRRGRNSEGRNRSGEMDRLNNCLRESYSISLQWRQDWGRSRLKGLSEQLRGVGPCSVTHWYQLGVWHPGRGMEKEWSGMEWKWKWKWNGKSQYVISSRCWQSRHHNFQSAGLASA